MGSIYAGIITYNPDLERLRQNIKAILPQVEKLIIVDNGSVSDIQKCVSDMELKNCDDKICFILNKRNFGVAYALNQVMKYSYKNGASWVLTLDQDTVVYSDIIKMYNEFLSKTTDNSIASLTCLRLDVNYLENGQQDIAAKYDKIPYSFVDNCITSGNLLSVKAWYNVKGFENKLFIDMVDDEFCYRLRANGYRIVRLNQYGYLHERGHNILTVNFFGKKKHIFAYDKKRKYYTARNIIYMCKKYHFRIYNKYCVYLLKLIIGTLYYEKNKTESMMAYFRGMIDGIRL